jgi:FAD/FMN-containing dehydrogenase
MRISGWGSYPQIEAQLVEPTCDAAVMEQIMATGGAGESAGLIPRGLGRSYGDSALAPRVLGSRYLNSFLRLDEDTGELTCGAGVSLGQVIKTLLPRGWFPPVVPGTQFVTLGGAVASDVHGKNHHHDGTFCDHVLALRLATPAQGIVECSREHRPDLFRATCGGMGLTGVILEVTFRLRRVASAYIDETTLRAANIREALALFSEHSVAAYSVAWIDCSASGRALGRSVLKLGEHSAVGGLALPARKKLTVPFNLPPGLLNRHSIRLFNQFYYHRPTGADNPRRVHLEPYFFPLDSILRWNRIYGRRGFLQYQLVLPRESGEEGLNRVLGKISDSGLGSFLAVLKAFGKANGNCLSFPMAGYTLALDFKRDKELDTLLCQLDEIVLDHGGRIYLTKDARMPESVFKRSYPDWEELVRVRCLYGADRVFNSLQSTRLGI